MPTRRLRRCPLRHPERTVLLAAALAAAAAPAAAQRPGDTVTVVPGARYGAGPLERRILGSDHRDLWTAPVRVPVLDPDTLGGLRVLRRGGGNQTASLHLMDAEGREFRFRSVAKWPGRGLNEALRGSVVHDVLQDQVHSLHPGATLAAAPIVRAAGVLGVMPRLYVMPDHPFLGELRGEFAGMLGTFEAHPTEDADEPRLRTADDTESTGDFLAELLADDEARFDARDYLRGRLVDLLIGDWDRHEDQYRWARFDRGGVEVWRAIPRDRDYAFVDYDGLLMAVVRRGMAKAVRFGPEIRPDLAGLTENPVFLDRRLLGGLSRADWEAETAEVMRRVTDDVIDRALAGGPPAWRARSADVAATLRARRASLPAAADAFYRILAGEAELHATDDDDRVEVERLAGGAVRVRIAAEGGVRAERTFLPDETREVRVFLHDGDDRAVVRGEAGPIRVRLVGGGGDDVLADSARGPAVLHDDDGEDRFVRGPGTDVDTRPWTPPAYLRGGGQRPPRDWGTSFAWLSPSADWRRHADVVVALGPQRTAYGFRRHPWASQQSLRVRWAPAHTRFEVVYQGAFRHTATDRLTLLEARAANLDAVSFHGFGNDSRRTADDNDARLWERRLSLSAALSVPLAPGIRAQAGPVVRWTDPEVRAGTPAGDLRPEGTRDFLLAGAVAALTADRRDSPGFPTRGWRAELAVDAWPLTDGVDGPVGGLEGSAATYLRLGGPVLAVRAGGRRVLGDFPVQLGATLGGRGDLRGFRTERFVGDAAVFGQAELRARLFPVQLLLNGDLGVFALADAGRVWYDGESPGDWHASAGGGVFFALLDGEHTVTVAAARGETTRLYFWLGVPF